MRLLPLALLLVLAPPAAASAQEHVGVSQQAQTVAPDVRIDRPQPPSCGAAPSVAQINRLIPVIRRMFPQPAGFDSLVRAKIALPCQRNRVTMYLLHVIAENSWSFLPAPGIVARSPVGAVACGLVPQGNDLNAVTAKLRALFADPRGFDANVSAMIGQPCGAARLTLYQVALMTDFDLAFRR